MSFSYKKWKVVLLVLFVVLIATNPSPRDFKDFESIESDGLVLNREYNFFVCSIYRHNSVRFLGIVGNFFIIH